MKHVALLENPVARIESSTLRDLSIFSTVFEHKLFSDCVLELVQLVNAKTANEIKNTRRH